MILEDGDEAGKRKMYLKMQLELIPDSPPTAADNVASDAQSAAAAEEAAAEQQKATEAGEWNAAGDALDDSD